MVENVRGLRAKPAVAEICPGFKYVPDVVKIVRGHRAVPVVANICPVSNLYLIRVKLSVVKEPNLLWLKYSLVLNLNPM